MLAIPDSASTQGDKGLWRRWRPWLIVSLAVFATLALLALALFVLPPLLIPGGRLGPPMPQTVPSVSPSPSLPQPSPATSSTALADLAKAENDVRGTLVAALGVLAVLIGAVVGFLTFRETQKHNRLARQQDRNQLDLTRRGQVNERFSKAIEQLGQSGDDKVDVRIGAIYSLEQVSRDSPEELHGPVIEILTAFLREHSRPQEEKPSSDHQKAGPPAESAAAEGVRLRADFQAIATVLGRRDIRGETESLDLSRVDLRGARLVGAHLERAYLEAAHLEKAVLSGAYLQGAFLLHAHLEEAAFWGAHLEEATLVGAHLEFASFRDPIDERRDATGLTLGQLERTHRNEYTHLPRYLQEPKSKSESGPDI